jgi:hypothetical protein
MKPRALFGLVLIMMVACPANSCSQVVQQVHARVDIPTTTILADNKSQDVFDAAFEWSAENHLETGGCFTLFDVVGTLIIVSDAVEKVNWRREDRVELACGKGESIWHVHWAPESGNSVGCNIARGQDIYLIEPERPLGLVVCGKGRLNLIPYNYDAKADSVHKKALRDLPGLKEEEDSLRKATNKYRCPDEPRASRERPALNCKEK